MEVDKKNDAGQEQETDFLCLEEKIKITIFIEQDYQLSRSSELISRSRNNNEH